MTNQEKINLVIEKHQSTGKFIKIDGIKTFVCDIGSGEPVLCIHGVPTSSFLYRKVIQALADKGHRGICVDFPGLGLSDKPENFEYSFSNFADFLAKVTDYLAISQYHLVVHDIGGPIGFALVANHQDRIKSLTILNTWIDVVNFQKPLPMRPFEKKVLGEAELKMINHTTWQLMFRYMGIKKGNVKNIPDEEINAYVDLLKRIDDGKAFLKIMRNFDNSEDYRQLCMKAVNNVPYPIQAIWGAEDPALRYKKYGVEIKKAANLDKVYKTEARHFLQEEEWEFIADKVSNLIKA